MWQSVPPCWLDLQAKSATVPYAFLAGVFLGAFSFLGAAAFLAAGAFLGEALGFSALGAFSFFGAAAFLVAVVFLTLGAAAFSFFGAAGFLAAAFLGSARQIEQGS